MIRSSHDLTEAEREITRISPTLRPHDQYNQRLQQGTHPPGWSNPTPSGRYNLVVIGAGTAGLVAAAGAAGLGAKVALIEKGLMGGDCLNVGCVPSKTLIRAARAVADVRTASEYGVSVGAEPEVDFPAVMERMRRLRAEMSDHDSVARFTDLGIDVYLGEACFTGRDTVQVEGQMLNFARAAITTGARAVALPIKGLEETGFLTNETVFSLTNLPARLAVIGAGPIGCEMAQAFARLGSQVTLIEMKDRVMPPEEADAAGLVDRAMQRDGVRVICSAKTTQVTCDGDEKVLRLEVEAVPHEVRVDEILIGVGRAPNVESLNLESAGVAYDKQGVRVNDFLQTSNPKIYAAGDVASKYKFTHAADAMARIVVQNALFFGRARASGLTIPWCTYTDPEVAHVGLYEEDAVARGYKVHTLTIDLADVDRARIDGETEGFLRVHLKEGSDQILGATLVARHAGEMISEITATMVAGKGLQALGKTIHPYPTQAEAIKKAADAYSRTRLTPRVKNIFSSLLAWRR